MDGRRFIKAMFASDKAHSITQVVMNLPNDAAEFLGMLSWLDHFLFLYNSVLYSNPTHLFRMI
jgi:hypothetical protein